MENPPQPEQLSERHTHWRCYCDAIWLILVLIPASAGGEVWLFTRNIEHLYSGLFYAIFPLTGLIYTHFVLLNPRRDPIETQQRLEVQCSKQKRRAKSVAIVNGSLLLVASPLLIVCGIAWGAQYGFLWAVLGGIFGSIWLVAGTLGIAWQRWSRHNDGEG